MKELMIELDNLRKKTMGDTNIIKSIEKEKALFPFSVENRLLAYYLAIGEITYERYSQLITEYCERNKYLDLFGVMIMEIWEQLLYILNNYVLN